MLQCCIHCVQYVCTDLCIHICILYVRTVCICILYMCILCVQYQCVRYCVQLCNVRVDIGSVFNVQYMLHTFTQGVILLFRVGMNAKFGFGYLTFVLHIQRIIIFGKMSQFWLRLICGVQNILNQPPLHPLAPKEKQAVWMQCYFLMVIYKHCGF